MSTIRKYMYIITFHIQCLQVLQIFNTVWQNWYSISFQIQDLQKKEYMYVFFDKTFMKNITPWF